jgi:preprotein translocase subunit SecF
VQPTDPQSLVGFRVLSRTREPRRRNERGTRVRQALVVGVTTMKARFMRIVLTLSSVAMIALAGGASLRGF